MLYDLSKDPLEAVDLLADGTSSDEAAIVASLEGAVYPNPGGHDREQRLREFLRSHNDLAIERFRGTVGRPLASRQE